MKMEVRMKKKLDIKKITNKTTIIIILTTFFSVLGGTYAYFFFSESDNLTITGEAATVNLELSVEMLAEKVYMAPSYLSHIFKKETGLNLSRFIKNYRMEMAKKKLETTHEKIVTISYSVGYQNVSYFCQNFREYFGVTPQKFRG